ncbi:sulfite exporter TauE/SafE family protein [Lyngbya confervoides]|uniref:Probable membrane transporter protein n=1 Tax=Lyngbya confervoides BDU141951 TaxID=1574623 RepID=A0ABD4T0Y6_9CYAN|nr:sulfite exporter TauE/SafE family protein [Lyngbya confervoides]MCM1982229.1 sulfite exporter TauE/SafE family protein [Lyngbya confervoides BDU141951]
MIWWIGHFLAAGIGVSLGLIGGGGSVLALPILVYVLGVPTKAAIPMTLIIVGTVSVLGLIPHWRSGNVNFKAATVFGLATMVGAYAGARLAVWVPGTVQLLLFGLLMFLAALFMIRKGRRRPPPEDALAYYPKPICRWCWLWLPTEGLGVGLMTGLVGVGGGFAIVPALVLLAKVPIKEAIGTSLLVIALNSVTGFMGYLGQVDINYPLMISMTLAASLGTLPGAYLSRYVSAQQLQKGFGYFLLAMAAFVLFQNRPQPTKAAHPPSHGPLASSGKSVPFHHYSS